MHIRFLTHHSSPSYLRSLGRPPYCPFSAKAVDCPGARSEFARMWCSFGYEILLTALYRNPVSAHDQRVKPLNDNKILVVVVYMLFGCTIFVAFPIGHLFVICSVVHPA